MVEENAIVQLKKLSKRFDQDQDVLSDIDLEVKEGEFISFVGPSGCGKSTLLRMLAGLTSVSEGALLIDVRTPQEYDSKHIEKAINIPVDEVETRLKELGDPKGTIIVYCRSGQRSAKARLLLLKHGFTSRPTCLPHMLPEPLPVGDML